VVATKRQPRQRTMAGTLRDQMSRNTHYVRGYYPDSDVSVLCEQLNTTINGVRVAESRLIVKFGDRIVCGEYEWTA
jgi:hypothetical protein